MDRRGVLPLFRAKLCLKWQWVSKDLIENPSLPIPTCLSTSATDSASASLHSPVWSQEVIGSDHNTRAGLSLQFSSLEMTKSFPEHVPSLIYLSAIFPLCATPDCLHFHNSCTHAVAQQHALLPISFSSFCAQLRVNLVFLVMYFLTFFFLRTIKTDFSSLP